MSTLTDKERQERDDVLSVMQTEQGRRFMWRLLGECRIYHDLEGDTNQILKSVGRRQIGLFLTGIIMDADELLHFKMQMESRNRTMEDINGNTRQQPTAADSFESIHSGDAYTAESGLDEYLPSYDSLHGSVSNRYT